MTGVLTCRKIQQERVEWRTNLFKIGEGKGEKECKLNYRPYVLVRYAPSGAVKAR
jgi:hypothetical protein